MKIEKTIQTKNKEDMIDITNLVNEELKNCNIEQGLATIFIPHTTAGITINENADPDVQRDIIHGLKSINLEEQCYHHMEGNSPAHIKASLIGSSINVIIENGQLVLGTWQGIYFCEFDGARNRKIIIHFM